MKKTVVCRRVVSHGLCTRADDFMMAVKTARETRLSIMAD